MSQLGFLGLLGFQLERERTECALVAHVTVPGEPVSKARHRFTKYGSKVQVYTPTATKTAEIAFGWHFRRAAPGWQIDSVSAFGVFAIFYPGTRQRRDVDNMTKLVLDACNGLVWGDDVQVTEISGRVVFDDPNPRTEVAIYVVERQPPPEMQCERCGKPFRTYKSWGTRRFCSSACVDGQMQDDKTVACKRCGRNFAPGPYERARQYCSDECRDAGHTASLHCVNCGREFEQWQSWKPSGNALCSRECGMAFWRNQGVKIRKGSCKDCGGPVARRETARCRACFMASKAGTARDRGPTSAGWPDRPGRPGPSKPPQATPGDPRHIREWAQQEGIACGPRGKLPVAVRDAYNRAHQTIAASEGDAGPSAAITGEDLS